MKIEPIVQRRALELARKEMSNPDGRLRLEDIVNAIAVGMQTERNKWMEEQRKNSMPLSELLKELSENMPNEPYQPGWFYNRAGNMIQAYWSPEAHTAEWLNQHLEIYRKRDTNEIIGCGILQITNPRED